MLPYLLTPPPQTMHLCVDGRMLGGDGTGVASYARALAEAHRTLIPSSLLLKDGRGSARETHKWLRRLRALWPGAVRASDCGDHALHAPDLFRLAQIHFDVHRRPLIVRPPVAGGIMHWTYPLPIRMAGWKNVYTIHDAIPLTRPDLTAIDGRRHARLLRSIAASADALVTVSEAAGREIAAALAISPSRLVNCSQAIAVPSAPGAPPPGLAPGDYLLAIGTVEPRKNIARLVAAHRAAAIPLPLVIAGPAADRESGLERLVAGSASVIRLPYVPAAAMPGLIAGARALLMPSLAEGFGLPVAEAMAIGTPVMTSRHGALAETAGNAALLVDPEDVGSISGAIRRIVDDDELHARLSRAGRRNTARFTPAAFAGRLDALYRSLLPSSPGGDTRRE